MFWFTFQKFRTLVNGLEMFKSLIDFTNHFERSLLGQPGTLRLQLQIIPVFYCDWSLPVCTQLQSKGQSTLTPAIPFSSLHYEASSGGYTSRRRWVLGDWRAIGLGHVGTAGVATQRHIRQGRVGHDRIGQSTGLGLQ